MLIGIVSIIDNKLSYGGLLFIQTVYGMSQDYIQKAIEARRALITISHKLDNLSEVYYSSQEPDPFIIEDSVEYNKLKALQG